MGGVSVLTVGSLTGTLATLSGVSILTVGSDGYFDNTVRGKCT